MGNAPGLLEGPTLEMFAFVDDYRMAIATISLLVVILLVLLFGGALWWLIKTRRSQSAASIATGQQIDALMGRLAAYEIANAALTDAREAAEAANIAKSRYLVGVSHEIRSPLNAIYGYAQLLERENAVAPPEAGRVIRRSSEHLTNIVDGLLDISRVEGGVLKLARDVVPLAAFLDSIVAMFRMQAENKGLRFEYRRAPNLPAFVCTDEKRLRQMLINLLSNAIKYTPNGSASLTVRYRSLVAEFEIADTGIGIPANEIDRIFEPFERGSASATRALPGTGLGLAITRVLAQVMGGEVSVTSTPGEGSIFRLRLMLAEPREVIATTARQRPVTGYIGRRRTILLIDDDPLHLAVLQGLLRPLGFTIYAAANGPDGIDLAMRCAPDLVLLDVQMPGMSGWDVATGLRAIDRAVTQPADRDDDHPLKADPLTAGPLRAGPLKTGPLKIVLVSANAHEFAAGGDGLAAHDGFVTKPVDLDSMLDVIAAQLGLEWQSDAADSAHPALPVVDFTAAGASLVELRRLGQVGHVRGIEAALTVLAKEQPASGPLVDQLRLHVRAFDLGGYLRLLDTYG